MFMFGAAADPGAGNVFHAGDGLIAGPLGG